VQSTFPGTGAGFEGPSLSARLVRALGGVGLGLLLAHAFFDLTWLGRHSTSRLLRSLLDVTCETSLWTWLSVAAALLAGLAGCALGALRRERGSWFAGVLFLYLSADDACQIHERLGHLVQPLAQGKSVFAWVLVFGPVFALLGLAAVAALARTLRGDRRAWLGILAGFACLAAALGLELLERRLIVSGATLRGFPLQRYTILIEEALELAGPLLVLAVLGSRVEAHFNRSAQASVSGAAASLRRAS
jgi:hypothetical protein